MNKRLSWDELNKLWDDIENKVITPEEFTKRLMNHSRGVLEGNGLSLKEIDNFHNEVLENAAIRIGKSRN